MKKSFVVVILPAIALLTGCSAIPTKQTIPDGPIAQVRFYGNNGLLGSFYREGNCRTPREDVSGGMGSSFKSFIGSDQNESIGMPISKRADEKRGRILAYEFYKEFVIAGNKPIAFQYTSMASNAAGPGWVVTGTPPSCTAEGRFFAEAGKNYDVYFEGDFKYCKMVVSEIAPNGSGIPVKVKDNSTCTD